MSLGRRPALVSAALLGLTVAAGLAIRFVHVGLPAPVTKYGGSALWALMIYWIVSSLAIRRCMVTRGLVAMAIATTVECLKLYRTPDLDAFRRTLAGVILPGRVFSFTDIIVYGLAIAAGVAIDRGMRSAVP